MKLVRFLFRFGIHMKKLPLFLILLPLWPMVTGATTYYVSNSGSESANGTSTTTPWQTVAHVNAQTFNPGDSILFQAGGTWREQLIVPSSGSAGSPITFGAYGSGNNPIFMASLNKSSTADWTLSSTNVWYTSGFPSDVGSIFVNGNIVLTGKVGSLAGLSSQGQFYYQSGSVYMYSTSNPATYYSGGIECWYNGSASEPPGQGDIIYIPSQSYLIFQDLTLEYGGGHGISGGNGCTNITIQGLNISYIGGSYLPGSSLRYGNAIQFYDSASNIIIQNNNILQIFDVGIDFEGPDNNQTVNGILVNGNTVNLTGQGLGISYGGTDNTIENISISCNTITNSGLSFSGSQTNQGGEAAGLYTPYASNTISNLAFSKNYIQTTRAPSGTQGYGVVFTAQWSILQNWIEDSTASALYFNSLVGDSSAGTTLIGFNIVTNPYSGHSLYVEWVNGTFNIYNNSFVNSSSSGTEMADLVTNAGGTINLKNDIFIQEANISNPIIYNPYHSNVVADYNLYYSSTAANLINWQGTAYTQTQWANYKTASGQDAHSPTPTSPLFTNGSGVYSVASDFTLGAGSPAIWAGVNVGSLTDYAGNPVHNPPSMGAFEYEGPVCTYSISPGSRSFAASGGTGTVTVTTQSGCPWTASSGASWMTITSGGSGTGSGTMEYSVAANTTKSSRIAASSISSCLFTLEQAGAMRKRMASAGTGGTISPSGSEPVASGSSQTSELRR